MRIYSYFNETVNSLDDAFENSIGFLNRQAYLLLLCSLCFLVPFALGEPQLVVGAVVNAALIAGAFKLRGWELLPLVTLPSLGALSRGLVFGPWTPYLALMLPFIWLGNAALVFVVKRFAVLEKKGFAFGNAAGIAAKVALIFCAAYALYSLGLLPVVFLTAMGLLQIVTAIAGAALAFGFLKAEARLAR